MTISIIIPCFNQGQYLTHAIESVLTQTRKADEIILINDGSTDDTKQIATQYPQVKYIEQVNKGLASARNTGIMNATGDYILPLDADDMLTEGCLERIEQVATATDADIIAPSFKCFGLNSDTVVLMQSPTIEDFKVANRIGYFSAIKRNVLLEVGGYSTRMIWGWEDWHLWFDLLNRGKKLVTISEVLVLYRTKERSMITVANEHAQELGVQIQKDFPHLFQ